MKNNTKKKQKKLRSIKFEPGPLQSPCILSRVPLAMFIALLLWQPLRNVAATLSAHYSVDALEVSMVTGMASRDCEGQSEPINGTMLRDRRNKKTAIKITNHASCHFYSCFAKKCLCVLCLVVFFPPVPCLPWSYCLCKSGWLLSVYRMYRGGKEHKCPFFPFFTALTNF